MSALDTIIASIEQTDPGRNMGNYGRRIMKLGEEYGEVCQAYLSVTNPLSNKNMSWADVREEICDAVIVAVDLMLTKLPDELDLTDEQFQGRILDMINSKLAKWQRGVEVQGKT
jgi:NTP pyrophosphatase (non-canonical NTP hydrolase)